MDRRPFSSVTVKRFVIKYSNFVELVAVPHSVRIWCISTRLTVRAVMATSLF